MPAELKFKLPVRVDGLDIVDADGLTIVDSNHSHFDSRLDAENLSAIATRINAHADLLKEIESLKAQIVTLEFQVSDLQRKF